MYIGIQVLRAKIRGMHAAGSSIRLRIKKSSGKKRSRLWDEKRELGYHTRYHLIAYGLLRGISYTRIERCARGCEPSANKVLELMKAHGEWKDVRLLTVDDVSRLLRPAAQDPQTTLEKRA